jgi:hypothetical protein
MITLRQAGGAHHLLERLPGHRIAWKARVARTFQNIRCSPGMTVLENLLVAQHNPLMIASGFTLFGILGLRSFKDAERGAVDKAAAWLDKIGLSTAPTIRQATCPTGRSAASRSPAPCAPSRNSCASTSRPPASIRAKACSSTGCSSTSAPTTRPRSCSSSTTCRW